LAARIPRSRQALYAAVAVLIFFASAELILRVRDFGFYYNYSADILGMPLLDMFRFRRIANNTVEFDRELFWKFKPNQTLEARGVYLKPVRINNLGFRGPDFQMPKRPGCFRIICLGDSVTFGWSVGEDETFPAQLSQMLKRNFPACDTEVINLGVTGYSSFQGKNLFLKIGQKLNPDLVIIGFGANDRYPALLSDQEHLSAGTWQPNPIELALRHSQVYKLVKSGVVYARRRRRGLSLDPKSYFPGLKRKVSEQQYLANLKAIKDECGKIGCGMILLNGDFPGLETDPALAAMKEIAARTGAQIPAPFQEWDMLKLNRQAASKLGAPLLDLREIFREAGPAPLMVDKGHPNGPGHRTIAEKIAQQLSALDSFQQFAQNCGK